MKITKETAPVTIVLETTEEIHRLMGILRVASDNNFRTEFSEAARTLLARLHDAGV